MQLPPAMIETMSEADELDALRGDWNSLAASAGLPTARYEWSRACALACCPPARLAVIVHRSGRAIEAVVPFSKTRRPQGEVFEILGASLMGEPTTLLYRDAEAVAEVIEAALAWGAPLVLERLPRAAAVLDVLERAANRRHALVTHREGGATPYIDVQGRWDDFLASMSSGRRSDLRRAMRRAESLGSVSFTFAAPTPAECEEHLRTVFEVERASWKGEERSAVLANPEQLRFFSEYGRAAAAIGMLRTHFMSVGGEPAAAILGIEHARRFWVLKIGYDRRFASCSPGILLIHESIRNTFETGLCGYEFMGWSEPWIDLWRHELREHVTSVIYPLSARGVGSWVFGLCGGAVRRIAGGQQG